MTDPFSLKHDQLLFPHIFLGNDVAGSSSIYVNRGNSNVSQDEIIRNRHLALKQINNRYSDLCILKQVHSDKVIIADKFFEFGCEPEADAIVTNKLDLPIAIVTADCVPILMADYENKVIAVIHAGWRGAKSDLIANTIDSMQKIGAKLDNIVAVIGPCILQRSYEVSEEFFQGFLEQDQENKRFFIPSTKDNHYMFDLLSYSISRIERYLNKIHPLSIDTFSSNQLFSFRRSTLASLPYMGNNISIIVMNS